MRTYDGTNPGTNVRVGSRRKYVLKIQLLTEWVERLQTKPTSSGDKRQPRSNKLRVLAGLINELPSDVPLAIQR